jgi:antitoxin component YwqK of YwqJK toxin-antitoxin module
MKRLISIFLFGALLQGAVAQEIKISYFDINYFKNTGAFELKDQVPNGVYKVYVDSLKTILDYSGEISYQKRVNEWTWYTTAGTKKWEVTYLDGVFNGLMVSYYPNGQQSIVRSFAQGVLEGSTTMWYPSGTKKYEGSCHNGKPSGTWKFWKEDGSLLKEEQH